MGSAFESVTVAEYNAGRPPGLPFSGIKQITK